jgi:hypothetical protein
MIFKLAFFRLCHVHLVTTYFDNYFITLLSCYTSLLLCALFVSNFIATTFLWCSLTRFKVLLTQRSLSIYWKTVELLLSGDYYFHDTRKKAVRSKNWVERLVFCVMLCLVEEIFVFAKKKLYLHDRQPVFRSFSPFQNFCCDIRNIFCIGWST